MIVWNQASGTPRDLCLLTYVERGGEIADLLRICQPILTQEQEVAAMEADAFFIGLMAGLGKPGLALNIPYMGSDLMWVETIEDAVERLRQRGWNAEVCAAPEGPQFRGAIRVYRDSTAVVYPLRSTNETTAHWLAGWRRRTEALYEECKARMDTPAAQCYDRTSPVQMMTPKAQRFARYFGLY